MKFYQHEGSIFNLCAFKHICRGDEDEILLTNIGHNGDWEDLDLKECMTLVYKSKQERDEEFEKICKMLGCYEKDYTRYGG